MEIPTIESRASNIPIDKGNYVCCHKGSTDKRSSWNMSESIWASRSRYWLLTGEVSRSRIHNFRTRRVACLTFVDARVVLGYLMSGNQMLFGVLDEISDVMRNLGMVERVLENGAVFSVLYQEASRRFQRIPEGSGSPQVGPPQPKG